MPCVPADAQVFPQDSQGVRKVDATMPLALSLTRASLQQVHRPCLHVMADGRHFFLNRQVPDAFAQLHQVFRTLPSDCGEVACFSTAGERLCSLSDMPASVLATVLHRHVTPDTPCASSHMLLNCSILAEACGNSGVTSGRLVVFLP